MGCHECRSFPNDTTWDAVWSSMFGTGGFSFHGHWVLVRWTKVVCWCGGQNRWAGKTACPPYVYTFLRFSGGLPGIVLVGREFVWSECLSKFSLFFLSFFPLLGVLPSWGSAVAGVVLGFIAFSLPDGSAWPFRERCRA